jgi:drug/metabolite transporter (DMT)-like permease
LLLLIKKENVYSSILTKKNFIEFSYVGLADSISYLLILYALTFVEVSYISPMRNSGIIISSFMGYFYLSEKLHKLRFYGSILIFIGIILTTIGIK